MFSVQAIRRGSKELQKSDMTLQQVTYVKKQVIFTHHDSNSKILTLS